LADAVINEATSKLKAPLEDINTSETILEGILRILNEEVVEAPQLRYFIHALVKKVLEDAEANTAETLKPILAEIKGQEARLAVLHQEQNKKKPEEITQQEKDDVHNTEKAISDEKAKRNEIISGYAKNNNIVHQLIDLALLQNGMLKGASLDAFLKRSVDMIK
jgi:molecular chaperone HtpG